MKDVEAAVKEVLLEVLDIKEEEIVPTARFVEDLKATSIDLVEIVAALQNTFDVDIDDDLSTQAAHVEWASKTKGVIEEGDDVQPFIQVWERLKTLALKPRESSQFVKRMMESISDE